VSGATYSSNAILAAYQDAYAQAVAAGGGTVETPDDASDETENSDADEETGENEDSASTQDEEQSEDVLPADGTYTASALCEPDEYEDFEAYTLTADVTFADGKLVSIDNLTSTDDSNVKYYTRAAEGTSKYTGVVAQLIDKQSSADIDAVSNATCSSAALVAIYEDAYAQAVAAAQTEDEGDSNSGETGDSASSDLTGTPADGTYTASALCEPDEYEDFEAYTLTADVTFADGKLVSIDNLTSTDDSNVKYYTRAAEGTSKYTGVVAQLIDKQSSADIDAVSNATCSSVALVAIYEDAYAQAVAANEQVTAAAVETDEDAGTEEAEPEEATEEETAEEAFVEEASAEEASTEETKAAEAESSDESTEELTAPTEQEDEEPAAEEEQTAGDETAAEETPPQSEKEDTEE
ncbi:MAG: FMN-binding protein, partial [Clostridiales bacterium]|nr:FMN-binding protein [Clostridiales bacterium]